MKAVILVGGEGTRLRPLTWKRPKAIVPILNQPFLEYLIDYLKGHGIEEIILAMGYLPDPIQECLGDGTKLGVRLHYVVEDTPLGTSGAVKNVEAYLDDSFLVFNGDIITSIDLTKMIKQHQESKSVVSIALTPVDNPTIYGVIETDEHGRVTRFVEKPGWDEVTTNMINAGIYILEHEVLARIQAAKPSMFEHDIFPSLLIDGQPIMGYPSESYWIDIGTPEKYLKVHQDLLRKKGGQFVKVDSTSHIDIQAKVEGPVIVGQNCVISGDVSIKGPAVIGAGCRLDSGAVIEGAVLWDQIHVGKGARLVDCVVATGGRIHDDCLIPSGCVLGDNVELEPGCMMSEGTKVDPDTTLG